MSSSQKVDQTVIGENEMRARDAASISDAAQTPKRVRPHAATRAIEILASGAPLDDVLNGITAALEAEFPGMLCSILVTDDSGARLRCAAAASLPRDYNQAIDGIPLDVAAATFGTAAHPRDLIVAEDVGEDPRWRGYRDVALRHRLRACWSYPILSAAGQLLGILAMYFREPRRPSAEHVAVVPSVASLVAIAIERRLTQERLSEIRERFDLFDKATSDVVWDWDVRRDKLWWSHHIQTMFGYPPEELESGLESLSNRIHADDRARVQASVRKALASGQIWSERYRFKRRDGTDAYVHDRGFIIRDDRGQAIRVVGAMADVTERTRVEAALRESERTYATLVSNLPGAVYRRRHDARWTTEFVSDGIHALTGYPPSHFLQHTAQAFSDLIHPDDRARVIKNIATAIAARRPFTNSYRIITASGEQKWIWGQGRAVQGQEGKALFVEGFLTDISELKRTEEALRESRSRLRLAVQGANIGLWDWNVDTTDVYLSPQWKRQLGYADDEIPNRRDEWRKRVHPDDLERVEAAVQACVDNHAPFFESEFRMRHKDGSYRWIYSRADAIREHPSGATRIIGCHVDITERKRHEEATARHAALHETLAALGQFALGHREIDELMSRAAADVTRSLGVEYGKVLQHLPEERTLLLRARHGWDASHPARATYGDRQESLESYCLQHEPATATDDFAHETRFTPSPFEADTGVRSAIAVVIHGRTRAYGVLSVHTKSARRFSADEVSFVQSVANVLAAAIDRKEAEQRLAQLAQFDPLTGLPNRNLFRDRLSGAILRAQRDERLTALLFLDIDRFKEINDTLGHDAGDQLLKKIGAILRGCLRGGDTVARIGGDEFTVILEEMTTSAEVDAVANKVLRTFGKPVRTDGEEFVVTASVGVAVYPYDGKDGDSLLKHADIAMYQAKNEGGNNVQYYASTMSAAASARVSLEHNLRQAIERGEFMLFYQPVVALETGAVVSLEALLRWRHPEWGIVAPGRFLPLAEQTGLIVPIGEWVLHEVATQSAKWRQAGYAPIRIAVNLSARQFRKSNLVDVIDRVLLGTGMPGDLIDLEITESLLMENPEASSRLLDQLKSRGMRVTLDDFGTGYSSFAYLKHFPLDTVKIDRSFVRDVTHDPDDAAIVTGMIELSHSLGLKLIAEGAETREQAAFLRERGADYAQGFLYSGPTPVAELQHLLRHRVISDRVA